MKSVFLISFLLFLIHPFHSQELWGTAGNVDWTLFKTNKDQTAYDKTYDLARNKSSYPRKGKLLESSNGKLYGLTFGYDSFQSGGSVYEVDPSTGVYRLLQDFIGRSSYSPVGGIIEASNGVLYGLTSSGTNSNSAGGVFSYNIQNDTLIELALLGGNTTIIDPQGDFLEATNGKLYATSFSGGANNRGTIFEYDISSNSVSIVHDFSGTDGSSPKGNLIQVGNSLYGLTNSGGNNQKGVLFEFSLTNLSFNKLIDLDSTISGSFPDGGLMQADNGKLYGLTKFGGANDEGVVFEYDISNNSIRKVVDLSLTGLGGNATGDWMQAQNGNLYAFCGRGGLNNDGALIEYNLLTDSVVKIFDFEESQGENPIGSLMQASDGKIYGTALYGGRSDRGTLFSFDIENGNVFDKIFDFRWYSEGFGFWVSPIQAMDGKLYGVTNSGGESYNGGTLYRVNPYQQPYSTVLDSTLVGYDLEKLFDFDSTIGNRPHGKLYEVKKGLLLGTTSYGGQFNQGVIYSYDYIKKVHTKLYDFDSSVVGAIPSGNIVLADNGKIYGTTETGGANGFGTIYEFDLKDNSIKQIAELPGSYAAYFYSGLMQASNGLLYAVATSSFGNSYGAVVKFDVIQSNLQIVYDFSNTGLTEPTGVLTEASDGYLYGLTGRAGRFGQGSIYRLDAQTDSFTVVHDFTGGLGGRQPDDQLIEVNGELFGVTLSGGGVNSQPGTIFKYDINTDNFTKLLDMRNGNEVTRPNNALVAVDSCHKPFVSSLFLDSSFVCLGDSVDLKLGASSAINDGGNWNLYQNSINGSPFLTSTANSFKFWLDSTTTIYIAASGGCAQKNILDSIVVNVKSVSIDTAVTGRYLTLTAAEDSASYQWYKCDTIFNPIAGATNQSFSPEKNGSYAVVLTKDGCSSQSSCKLVIGVGIDEALLDSKFTVFPNPTTGRFILKVSGHSKRLNTSIRNLQGQLISEQHFSNSSQVELEIPGKAGIYFLGIWDENGEFASLKVVKR